MRKINLGIVGLGQRGRTLLGVLKKIDMVNVVAICDTYEDRVQNTYEDLCKVGFNPAKYNSFDEFIKNKDMEAVFISTSWKHHVRMAIACMEAGKKTAMEVGGARTVEECYQLVETYEKTKTPFFFLENCCYDEFELLATRLARTGFFGNIVHCKGAYSHDLRDEILGGKVNRHYRLEEYIEFNCDNYPTHELGPIAKLLNVNRGNRMVSLVSVASTAQGLTDFSYTEKNPDKTLAGKTFKQGDIVNTVITCANGETILLTLDTTLPGFYSRDFTVRGTKGFALQEINAIYNEKDKKEELFTPSESVKKLIDSANKYREYLPDYWRNITEEERKGAHGGMDYFMCTEALKYFIEGGESPIDVYDAVSWMVITALTQKSIENFGQPIEIPDFTSGKWKTRPSKDVI